MNNCLFYVNQYVNLLFLNIVCMTKILLPIPRVIAYKSKLLKDGSNPINLVVTHRGRRKYFSLKMSAKPNEWYVNKDDEGFKQERFRRNKNNYKHLNRRIEKYRNKALDIIEKLVEQDRFSFSQFESEFFRETTINNVFDYFDQRKNRLIAEGRIRSGMSVGDTMSFVLTFAGNRNLIWNDISYEWVKKFQKYGRTYISPFTKRQLKINTLGVYLRTFKATYNDYRSSHDRTSSNAFEGIVIEKENTRKRAILKEEVLKIKDLKFTKFSNKWFAQKYFLFSYLNNGINFSDMAHLNADNIIEGRLQFVRRKTRRKQSGPSLNIKLNEVSLDIINDMKGIAFGNFLFPILKNNLSTLEIVSHEKNSLKVYNKNLKLVASDAEVDSQLMTSYVGRHTYATVLKRNGVATEVIQEGLNHTDKTTTEIYLDSFSKDVLDEANTGLL